MKSKILIIGKTPPPIGGVTIHVQRLLDNLTECDYPFKFIQLNYINLIILPFYFILFGTVHLHSSNLNIQYFIVILGKIFKNKTIITFHRDIERYKETNKKKFLKVINSSTVPIVLNQKSFDFASKINKNTQLISAFLPPLKGKPLSSSITEAINHLRKSSRALFATNASGFNLDKNGQEIYGVIDLIHYFNHHPELGLVISDPTGQYESFLKKETLSLSANLLLISEPHSYFNILKKVDASIRNTITDGDSLSVRESLYLNKLSFATDVVSRPQGTILYKQGNYPFKNYKEYKIDKNAIFDNNPTLKALIKIYNEPK